ncbi:hypothetical protein AWB77_01648 [Caballeronia fortuita]|uniref:Uncharacterized protein n=1 Tax=Caballeronia fortuita TaxID=1777138 RepID=A0A158ACY0_9BURK|nr:hypothetical protein AWB77_01648 [Caballeronia fortuita]
MIPVLLETIGALSLLVSVAAKIALLHGTHDDDVAPDKPEPAPVRRIRAACFRKKERRDAHRARLPVSARCVRSAAGRAAFARTHRHG